jgi:hypothetical protein
MYLLGLLKYDNYMRLTAYCQENCNNRKLCIKKQELAMQLGNGGGAGTFANDSSLHRH